MSFDVKLIEWPQEWSAFDEVIATADEAISRLLLPASLVPTAGTVFGVLMPWGVRFHTNANEKTRS